LGRKRGKARERMSGAKREEWWVGREKKKKDNKPQ